MKKILILCFSVLCSNLIWGQTIYVNNSPTSVEVGINNNFSFQFNPPISSLYGNYNVSRWEITSSNSNMNNSGNSYYNAYFSSGVPTNTAQSSTISIPIKWEDNSNSLTDRLRVKVTYSLQNTTNTSTDFGRWFLQPTVEYNITKSDGTYYPYYDISVFRILSPSISFPTILNCSTDNVQICARNYGTANSFDWSVTNANIVSGQGSSCITVIPAAIGVVSSTCVVKRSAGLPTYTRSYTNNFGRVGRTIQVTGNNTPYICQGLGKVFQIDNQSGISSVVWSAPNCSISAETIVNVKRQVTVTPSTAIQTGNFITVTATANYNGDCTASNYITVPVGGPRTTMANANFVTSSAPAIITATANQNYLQFTLNAPLGNYTPSPWEWQYEKISGNFFFNGGSSGYTATTVYKQVADLYLTGPNPIGTGLRFRARVKSECGWGLWTEYIWNDGTTTPPVVVTPPANYFKVTPIPLGTSPLTISLLNPAVVPPASSVAVKLYNIMTGQVLYSTTMFNNYIQFTPSITSSYMYVSLTFAYDNHTESITVLK